MPQEVAFEQFLTDSTILKLAFTKANLTSNNTPLLRVSMEIHVSSVTQGQTLIFHSAYAARRMEYYFPIDTCGQIE